MEFLKALLDKFNIRLHENSECRSVKFYTHASILEMLFEGYVCGSRPPLAIRLAPDSKPGLSTPEIVAPDGTLEARFWHCSDSGEMVRKVNEFMIAWITKLANDQKEKKPLEYKPLSIEKREEFLAKPQLLKSEVDNLCRSIRLSPQDYYCIFDRRRLGLDHLK